MCLEVEGKGGGRVDISRGNEVRSGKGCVIAIGMEAISNRWRARGGLILTRSEAQRRLCRNLYSSSEVRLILPSLSVK